MNKPIRTCPQCGNLVEGRPNKKYCSEACKGLYFRENAGSESLVLISKPDSRYNEFIPIEYEEVELEEEDQEEEPLELETYWQKREREEKAQKDQRTATELHEQFCQIVKEFLAAEGRQLAEKPVSEFLDQVDELSNAYRQHPYVKQAASLVPQRLKELYKLQDILRKILQKIGRKSLWQSKSESYELTSKWRKLLRSLMIVD
ncbi:hypothetical protein [Hymenobacter volaticus]|uniref:DUF2116 family Zn-ribbon domain-containing protein n=1 Tax=Hymenobacter volaticus TaxID=2932254 RepID=A0ABY4G4E3_9BACT|nr:hypothetical protein [Hymenobacter volaticus]UOQ65717.1 hypothetical protein MUN86_19640 [Hymenobacter volaticus]